MGKRGPNIAVFSEKTDVPHLQNQSMVAISVMKLWPWKLKNRSRSPKPNQHFNMSQCHIHANLVEICQPVHEIWCTQAPFGLNLAVFKSPAVTLKIRSRSPKPNQLFIMSQCYIHANLVKIHPPVHETDADANWIRTKTMSPSVGDINTIHVILAWNEIGRSAIFGKEIGVPDREFFRGKNKKNQFKWQKL